MMIDRRRILQIMGGATLIPLVGCGGDDDGGATADGGGTSTDGGSSNAACATIPEETQGPYPGDGTNGANYLALAGMVRSDIRSSIVNASGTAAGVPLTLKLTLVSSSASCAPLSGYGIYVWHCTRDGQYSMYTLASENYLRGVQPTDENGVATFTSIFPGCYSGRWPHVHFEIYPSVAKAASGAGNKVKTSQLALPKAACDAVYATSGYSASVTNLAQTSLTSDMVFSDGSTLQVAEVAGSVASGYTATLQVAIAA